MQLVDEKNWDTVVAQSQVPVVVDFFATWCGPCRMLKPVLNEISNENSEIKVVMVDADACPDICDKYKIDGLPTILIMKNNQETNRLVGLHNKNTILEATR